MNEPSVSHDAVEENFTNENDVFEFLDELRVSGDTNMFGATSYIMREFGLNRAAAREHLTKWMDTFGERHPDGRS